MVGVPRAGGGEEVDDLGLGVRVIEPDGAFVGGVGGVVGEFGGVEGVPASRGMVLVLCWGWRWGGGGTIVLFRARMG